MYNVQRHRPMRGFVPKKQEETTNNEKHATETVENRNMSPMSVNFDDDGEAVANIDENDEYEYHYLE